MSTQSSSKDGEQQRDEKVALVPQESQLEPALAPPPPSNPPSSSSVLPPAIPDPTQLNVTSASSFSGDSIASQIAQLFFIVGRLSSENEALKAQGNVQASINSRLSSENEELRKKVEETERTMEEMSKTVGSHWVWEAGRGKEEGGKGRWTWSGEKHSRAVLQVARSKPPPSLDSIPVELITSIFSLLDRPDHLALCGVSFRLLQVASGLVYEEVSVLGSSAAASFVSARASNLNPPSIRISTLLLPSFFSLSPTDFDASHFAPLFNGGTHPFPVHHVAIHETSSSSLSQWSPILCFLDPLFFHLFGPKDPQDRANLVPTALELKNDDLLFAQSWTRLKGFGAVGTLSVPVLSSSNGRFALSESLRRCNPEGSLKMRLVSAFTDGRSQEVLKQFEEFEEKGMSEFLASAVPPDPTRDLISLEAAVEGLDAVAED